MSPIARALAFVVTALGLGVPGLAMAEGSAHPVFIETSRLALRDDNYAPIDVRRLPERHPLAGEGRACGARDVRRLHAAQRRRFERFTPAP